MNVQFPSIRPGDISKMEFQAVNMDSQKPGSRCYVPCDEMGVPELWEGEEISFQLNDCEISFSAATGALGKGRLYITTKRMLWVGETVDSAFDYDIAYICLHAVSRDEESYPKPCVYCQLDVEEQEDEDETEVDSEVFLVPEKEEDIMRLFDALSHAAMLNPDPEEEGDELNGDFIYDGDEVALGAEQARILNHLDSVFHCPEDDEEEDGEDEEGEGEKEDEAPKQ